MFIREKHPDAPQEPVRFKRYKYGFMGARLALPILTFVVGVLMALVGFAEMHTRGIASDPTLFYIGLGLTVFGVVAFLLGLWMGKRGL
jgi:hypothetical protein